MKVCLTTFNAKYIHKALSLRWLYVAKDEDIDTEIVEYTINDDLNKCVNDMLKRKPDVIGCSVYIWNAEIIKDFIIKIKQILPHVRIILGGPEVSYEPESWLVYPIECVLRGEGEKTFWQAVKKETNIDGFYSKDYISSVPYARVDLKWLETLDSPYFLEFDQKDMANRYFYFETSRGCPYECSYCLSSLDRKVRFFSEKYIFNQLKKLEVIQVKQIKLLDRTFNASDEFSYRFVKRIEELNINCSLQFEIVADKLSKKMLDFLLNEATVNRYRFEIGIQSFHTPTLEAVGRRQNLEKCKEVIQLLTNKGYVLHTDLIGGLPYEDLRTFEKSYNELFSTGAKEIQVGLLKLLKGTRLKQEAQIHGMIYNNEAPYTIISNKWLSKEDVQIIDDVYHATEKLYNSERCSQSIRLLFELNYITNPFKVMSIVGKKMKEFKQIQVYDYFHCLYDAVIDLNNKIDKELLMAILQTDYVMKFKQRTKRLFDYKISDELQKKIRENCVNNGLLPEQQVYNYTDLVWGVYQHELCVMMLIYSEKQTLPKVMYFDKYGEEIV